MGAGDSKQQNKDLQEDLNAAKLRDQVQYEEIVSSPRKLGGRKGITPKSVFHDHSDHHDSPARRKLDMSAISEAGLGGVWDDVGSPIRVRSNHSDDEIDNPATNPEKLHLAVRSHARRIADEEFASLHDVQGDVKLLSKWIKQHGLRVCDSRGITLLHLANSVKFYTFLLAPETGMADMINVRCIRNRTPLHYRAERGAHLDVINLLINAGASPIARDKDFITPLHLAAANNHAAIVRLLLERYDVPVDIFDRRLQTAFHEACWGGGLETLDVLIEYAAKRGLLAAVVDKPDDRGVSPLLAACTRGHVRIVQRLLQDSTRAALIDVDRCDAEGDGCLNRCTWDGHVDVAKILLGLPLQAAAEEVEGKKAAADDDPYATPGRTRPLVSDVNVRDLAGLTPLHSAVFNHQVKMAALLLASGAAVDAQDNQGDTPLHIAVESAADDCIASTLQMLKLLCSRRGANVYLKNNSNLTAPQLALELARIAMKKEEKGEEEGEKSGAGKAPTATLVTSKAAYRVAEFLVRFIKGMAAKKRKEFAEISLRLTAERMERLEREQAEAAASQQQQQQEQKHQGQQEEDGEVAESSQTNANDLSATSQASATFVALDESALERAFQEEALKSQQQQPDGDETLNESQQINEEALNAAFEALQWDAEPHSPVLGAASALAAAASLKEERHAAEVAEAVHAEVSHPNFDDHVVSVAADAASSGSSPMSASLADFGSPIAVSGSSHWKRSSRGSNRAALSAAAQEGDLAKVKALLDETPALLTQKDLSGRTAVALAAFAGQRAIVAYLISCDRTGGDMLKMRDNSGKTALHHALLGSNINSSSRLEVCKIIVTANSALASQPDGDGNTPLHLAAAQSGTKMLMRFLCLSGADPKKVNSKGQTALDVALAAGHGDNAEYLRVVSAFSAVH